MSNKIPLLIILCLALLSACVRKAEYPVIVIDDNHYDLNGTYLKTHPSTENDTFMHTEDYHINPTKVLIIDPTSYDFSVMRKMNKGADPDLIHFILNKEIFVADLDPTQKTTVDSSTARNMFGEKKFSGLNMGDTAFISIGTFKMEGRNAQFFSFWNAMIIAK